MNAKVFTDICKKHNLKRVVGVSCSIFTPLINHLISDEDTEYLPATNEGEAAGIAAGLYLAAEIPIVILQNSGFGNLINPLTSLYQIYNIAGIFFISWRGEPDKKDAPQHKVMGKVTFPLAEVLDIKTELINLDKDKFEVQFDNALEYVKRNRKPFIFVVSKGTFTGDKSIASDAYETEFYREGALKELIGLLEGDEIILSTTGYTSRELCCGIRDVENHFYMVGSMGLVSAIGFGISRVITDKKIVVLDGDGSVLMKMGDLATIGHFAPKNFLHVIFDNAAHDSTGGQKTVSTTVDWELFAKSIGYKRFALVSDRAGLQEATQKLLNGSGTSMLVIRVKNGTPKDLPRPEMTPPEIKSRFQHYLEKVKNGL